MGSTACERSAQLVLYRSFVVRQVIALEPTGAIVVAHVLGMHIRDDAVVNAERCYIDTPKLNLIGRMESPGWYTRTHDRFKMKQLQVAQWESAQVTPAG